jgi:hypothetical protein
MIGQLKAPSFPDMEDGAFLFEIQIKNAPLWMRPMRSSR